ncbi:MAG: MFS transporter [Candidatus Cryptobacteroides sp.]
MRGKQQTYLGPFITMVILFFVVGFLTTANTQFQGPLKETFLKEAGQMNNTLATFITFSWFLAYPIAGSVGARWVAKRGYKKTLVRGMAIMVVGLLLFYLSSSITVQYPDIALSLPSGRIPAGYFIFLSGSFITGFSATVLQVVINPYLSASNVEGTQAVQRLAIGGASNSIGTTLAPYFVTGIVFGGAAMSDVTIASLGTPFISLAAFSLLMLLALRMMNLPDIDSAHAEKGEELPESIWSFRHLTLGVAAIFCYVGAEVCIGANINMYAIEKGLSQPALLATIYWGGMLAGRLAGSTIRHITPGVQLTLTTTSAIILLLLAIIFDNPWILAFVGLFHSIMWGCIFTLATSRLGKYTNEATGVFMIGVVGGAVFPLLQAIITDVLNGWRLSWILVIACELFMLHYARYGSRILKSAE